MHSDKIESQVGTLSRQQKYALVFLCSFALLILALGMNNFNKTLKSSQIQAPQQEIPTDEVVEDSQNLVAASKTDTDKDGLSDYDERNIYRTSPYLPDTDGDGVVDGDEIRNGSDPLCAAGQNCTGANPLTSKDWSGAASSSGATQDVPGALTAEQLQQLQMVQQLSSGVETQDLRTNPNTGEAPSSANASSYTGVTADKTAGEAGAQAILNGQADAATLRASLINSGIPKADLDKISDDILLKNYSELLAQQKK